VSYACSGNQSARTLLRIPAGSSMCCAGPWNVILAQGFNFEELLSALNPSHKSLVNGIRRKDRQRYVAAGLLCVA
jgi:hypothetical protein